MEQITDSKAKKNDSKVADIGNNKIKAEAIGVTVQSIIDAVPEQSKFIVLSSLVSSISCSVIGAASSVLGRFERMENVEIRSLERNEILHLMLEADMRQDFLRNTRSLVQVREVYLDQLLPVANDDTIGSWNSSIEFMTTVSGGTRINKERLFEAFKICGITDEETLETMYQASLFQESNDRIRNAEQISARRGNIEWFIENIFSSKEYINEAGKYADDNTIVHRIEDLPSDLQNRLYDKIRSSLSKSLTRSAARFAVGDTRYEINDLVILKELGEKAKHLESFSIDD